LADYPLGVKILIEMPPGCYDNLLRECDQSSPERQILVNGCIDEHFEGRHKTTVMQVLCDIEDVRRLLDMAINLHSDAAPLIAKALHGQKDMP